MNLNGIFPIIKPQGITSSQTIQKLRYVIFNDTPVLIEKAKIGHGGTLDSQATGILVVGVGNKCSKLVEFQKGEKSYRVNAILGTATDNYNYEGKVIMEKSYDHVDINLIRKVSKKFVGRFQQVPPIYSAIKLHGERYSDLARRGVKVDPKPRNVQCFNVDITDFSSPVFSLNVTCGGGFYVRSLVHDIGLAAGSCAHVTFIERTQQGPFTIDTALREEHWSLKNVIESVKANRKVVDKYFLNLHSW